MKRVLQQTFPQCRVQAFTGRSSSFEISVSRGGDSDDEVVFSKLKSGMWPEGQETLTRVARVLNVSVAPDAAQTAGFRKRQPPYLQFALIVALFVYIWWSSQSR